MAECPAMKIAQLAAFVGQSTSATLTPIQLNALQVTSF